MPGASSHLPTPTRVLGRYAMYEQFASGGMATVHFGRLLGTAGFSRTVAIKQLHAHLSEDPDFVAMFLDEARLAARIQHPNVIQTLDVVSSEGELFVVLDYVHGDSLSRLLREAHRLGEGSSPALVGAILFQALEGLHAAHEARNAKGEPMELVHRDVSPHNVLVGTDGVARVLDFGVAKARGRAQTTRTGQLKGKLSYMAPEQFRGNASRRSDVFSASVVLWEALTQTRLFRGEDEAETVDRLLHRPIPSPREFAAAVSPKLEAVVMRGLERDASKRYATAREMAIALEQQVALATPIEVGGWVQHLAGATLEQRAKRVTAIEEEFQRLAEGRPGTVPQADGVDTSVDVARSAPRLRAASMITAATVPTVAVPGLARNDDKTTVDQGGGELTTGTGIATVSHVGFPVQRRSRTRIVSLVSAIGAVSLALVFFVMRGGGEASPPAGAAGASATARPVVSASALPASTAEPSPQEQRSPETPAAPPPARRAPAVAPVVRKRPDCSPAYTLDARGVRHYKPECL
jgi:serine/threonine-protein kinase